MASTLNSCVSAGVEPAGDHKMTPLLEVRLKDVSTASRRAESARWPNEGTDAAIALGRDLESVGMRTRSAASTRHEHGPGVPRQRQLLRGFDRTVKSGGLSWQPTDAGDLAGPP